MNIGNLTIRARLILLSSVALVCLVAVIGFSIWTEYSGLMRARETKTRQLVEVAASTVQHYMQMAADGKMTEEEAKAESILEVRQMRYDGGAEYFWINDLRPTMVMHPMKPELDGRDLSAMADPNGKKIFVEFADAVQKSPDGGAFVNYVWPKGAEKEPQPKISYVKLLKPWNWVIGSGIYVDDVYHDLIAYVARVAIFALVALLAVGGISWMVVSSVQNGMNNLTHIFSYMLKFDFTQRPKVSGEDEIATVSRGLGTVIENVSGAIREVLSSSQTMAAAAEEMASSTVAVRDISRAQQEGIMQISTASNEAAQVVGNISMKVNTIRDQLSTISHSAENANQTIRNLQAMANRVSEVSGVINGVSEQINLLALNAAIEAARAGDAGRGFAVVADEVRKLAAGTAKSVGEINEVMLKLQASVDETSAGLGDISRCIIGINNDVLEVASAMNEQSASMSQISQSVQDFSARMAQLDTSIEETGVAANSVAEESGKLTVEMGRFKV